MTGCRHKLGFLSLKNCNLPADMRCNTCNRPVCTKHSRPLNEETVCLECFIEKNQKANGEMTSSFQRNRIYRDTGYHGVYADSDYDAFDAGSNVDFDVDDDIDPEMFQDS